MNLSIEVKFVLAMLVLAGVTMLRLEAIEHGKALERESVSRSLTYIGDRP